MPDEESSKADKRNMPHEEFLRRVHYLDPRFKASLAGYRDRWIIPFEADKEVNPVLHELKDAFCRVMTPKEADSLPGSHLSDIVNLYREHAKSGRASETECKQDVADLFFEIEEEKDRLGKAEELYPAMAKVATRWARETKARLREEFELQRRWSGFPAPWLSAKHDDLGESQGGVLPSPEYFAKWIAEVPRAGFRSARAEGASDFSPSRLPVSGVKSWLKNTLPARLARSVPKVFLGEMRRLTDNENWKQCKRSEGAEADETKKLFVYRLSALSRKDRADQWKRAGKRVREIFDEGEDSLHRLNKPEVIGALVLERFSSLGPGSPIEDRERQRKRLEKQTRFVKSLIVGGRSGLRRLQSNLGIKLGAPYHKPGCLKKK